MLTVERTSLTAIPITFSWHQTGVRNDRRCDDELRWWHHYDWRAADAARHSIRCPQL